MEWIWKLIADAMNPHLVDAQMNPPEIKVVTAIMLIFVGVVLFLSGRVRGRA
jgi:hypothetical protein